MLDALRQRLPAQTAWRALELVAALGVVLFVSASVVALPGKAVVGMLLAAIAAVFFFARPAQALLGIFALRVIIDLLWQFGGSGPLNLLEAFGGGVAALAAVLFYLELRRVERQPGFLPLVIYITVLVLAALRSFNIRDAAEILAKFISPLLLMFLVSMQMNTAALRRRFLLLVTAAGTVSLALSCYHLATGQRFKFFLQGYYRLHGGYNNLHNHALFLLFLNTLLFLWFMTSQRRWQRALALGLQAAALLCLYFTFVRTAMTGFAVFVALYLALERRWNLLFGAFLAAVLLLATNTSLQDRFYDVVVLFSEDSGFGGKRTVGSGRIGIWSTSVAEYFRQGPVDVVLGKGLGGHYTLTDAYADLYRSTKKSEDLDPHNDYLSLLFQLGPIAVVSYVALQIIVVRHGLVLHRHGREAFTRSFGRYMIALTAVATVTNSLSNSFIQRVTVAWLFWGMVGILNAMHRAHLQEAAEAPPEPGPPGGL